VAGAAVEFDLSPQETYDLAGAVATASGHAVHPAAVAGFRPCYAALQAGAWALAEAGADACEAGRISLHRKRYAAHLGPPM
jgi:hypothetical protein